LLLLTLRISRGSLAMASGRLVSWFRLGI
jgi:hypothetical protein